MANKKSQLTFSTRLLRSNFQRSQWRQTRYICFRGQTRTPERIYISRGTCAMWADTSASLRFQRGSLADCAECPIVKARSDIGIIKQGSSTANKAQKWGSPIGKKRVLEKARQEKKKAWKYQVLEVATLNKICSSIQWSITLQPLPADRAQTSMASCASATVGTKRESSLLICAPRPADVCLIFSWNNTWCILLLGRKPTQVVLWDLSLSHNNKLQLPL